MELILIENRNGIGKLAKIQRITKKDLPLKKDGWSFNWRRLFNIEGSELFKITLIETPKVIQGILMLTMFNSEMLFMNNIEIAPHNIGKSKKYINTAGVLLVFACKKSFEKGKGNYQGFLSFDSKAELIDLYERKYGATIAMGHKMFFDPKAGKVLIKKYMAINK